MQQSLVEISTTRRSVSKFTKDAFLRELFQEKTSLCLHFNQLYLNPFPNKPLPISNDEIDFYCKGLLSADVLRSKK